MESCQRRSAKEEVKEIEAIRAEESYPREGHRRCAEDTQKMRRRCAEDDISLLT